MENCEVFSGTFCRAQPLKLLGVATQVTNKIRLKIAHGAGHSGLQFFTHKA